MAVTPYVVGQWVRGDRFYGRRALIEEILSGHRNCLWILGTRRVGKTSILKQLEQLTATAAVPGYFPLFWDFQGCERQEDLHEGFRDSLFDAIERLEALGIDLDAVDSEDLFTAMGRLRRELHARDLTLLLLGDEAEELVGVYPQAPRFLRRLRRSLQSPENIRTVFASTIRLWNLASEETTTSPFLHGFTPPLPVRGLSDDDARALIRQTQLPREARPQLDEQTVEAIRRRGDNHPYLLQLLSERYGEVGDLERAIEEIANDQMVSFFFASDLSMLSDAEQRILHLVGEQAEMTDTVLQQRLATDSTTLQGSLQRLEQLGFIGRTPAGELRLANYFFRRWFEGISKGTSGLASPSPRPVTSPGKSGAHDAESPTLRTPTAGIPTAMPGAGARVDDRYDLLFRLGRGASGEVYKARDDLLRTIVAIKLLKPEYCVDDDALERLRREVVLARDLSHPNILRVYHLGEDRGQHYITMQYVDGPDLAQVLATEAPLSTDRVVLIAGKLAAALSGLHRFQVLHRDIKPSNVLIDRAGEPRITDFGLARLQSGPGITHQGMFLGTPSYASPEQASGAPLDERSDLYSLGIVIFQMATGRLPFESDSARTVLVQHLNAEPPSPRDLRPELPAELSDLILRCLAKKPEERFQNAGRLSAALQQLSTA